MIFNDSDEFYEWKTLWKPNKWDVFLSELKRDNNRYSFKGYDFSSHMKRVDLTDIDVKYVFELN